MKRAVAIVAIALTVPGLAAAHVIMSPPFVNDGVETEISLMAPNERTPHATVSLRATAPPGIEVVSATAPAGWQSSVSGSTVTWSGGRLTGPITGAFPLHVLARVRAGTYPFEAAQSYDDGATVRWKVDLSVLPASGAAAPSQDPWGAVAAALVGVAVIAGTLIGVRLLRRRSKLQDP